MTKHHYTIAGKGIDLPMTQQEARKYVLGLDPSSRIDLLIALLSDLARRAPNDVLPNFESEGRE